MSLLADIDATCASLGYNDGAVYHTEPDALQGLKHLIWILRRDSEIHEYRRHLGRGKVLQTDLLPMLMHQTKENELSDVLLRLLVNLTNPALLLYREELPKDGPGHRNFLELVEILQGYKEAYALQPVWAALGKRLQTVLEIDWAERSEEQGLLIERILVLVRNVLQVPSSPDTERRADNDASVHDQVLWALQQAGVLDLVLYIIGSEYENQYHLHALEIVCLMYREQTAASLADASLKRSAAEKHRDEQELIAARKREKAKYTSCPPPGRHSRFGGTYVLQNIKSISDKDIICHQSLVRAVTMDFNREKNIQKRSHRIVQEEGTSERRSAFSIRLFLREFCIEILGSAYNNLIRQVRRILERNSSGNDDSYLLWAIRFFLEFNRLSGFQLQLVSESLSTQCFHWILTRIQHHMDMIGSDKKLARLWARRLNIAIQAFKELLFSLIALQKVEDEDAQGLYKMLLNNVCYVLEFRETILYTVMNYNEAHSTKAYLRHVIELTNTFFKIMQKFCKGSILVQDKKKNRRKGNKNKAQNKKPITKEQEHENLENIWAATAAQLTAVLANDITLPEEEHPIPFDAVSDKTLDDQKDDCMIKIHSLLRQEKFEHAIILMRSAREVWPEDDCFGSFAAAPEDELMLLRDIFLTNLGPVNEDLSLIDGNYNDDNDGDQDDDDDEEGITEITETDFRFEDFEKRLLNPRVVRACTIVLTDWEKITTQALKSAVTILHRIAFGCKVPAMLFQASLFRIFQGVLNAGRDPHHEELRKIAVYVVRQFVTIAPTNPKIYAELLFYKTIREANEVEMGYDGAINRGNKISWTEEQEDELRQLYMENQTNPATDQDVIDWIADNMIEKSRTRRAIIKKLKELGLIFKAPTKKSIAATLPKNFWRPDQDQELRDLFDEHRINDDCLARIMEVFSNNPNPKSKNVVINRMIQLGLIAERSDILPRKKKQSKKSNTHKTSSSENESNDSSDDDELHPPNRKAPFKQKNKQRSYVPKTTVAPKKKEIPKITIDVDAVKNTMSELDDSLKEVLNWVQESLEDAAEDMEDPSDNPEDGVPLVPLRAEQRDALENVNFKYFLISLGFQPPAEVIETYWRIPNNFTAEDIKLRAKIVAGEEIEANVAVIDTDSEPEIIQNDYSDDERHKRESILFYGKSDNEEEAPSFTKRSKKPIMEKNKFTIFDMVKDSEPDNIDDVTDTQVIRNRLAALVDSDESDNEPETTIVRKRIKQQIIIDTDSEEEITMTSQPAEVEVLDQSQNSLHVAQNVSDIRLSNNKRERSELDEFESEEEILEISKKVKKVRKAIIDDDDDE